MQCELGQSSRRPAPGGASAITLLARQPTLQAKGPRRDEYRYRYYLSSLYLRVLARSRDASVPGTGSRDGAGLPYVVNAAIINESHCQNIQHRIRILRRRIEQIDRSTGQSTIPILPAHAWQRPPLNDLLLVEVVVFGCVVFAVGLCVCILRITNGNS